MAMMDIQTPSIILWRLMENMSGCYLKVARISGSL
jgi:hypothetical protein